MKVEFIVTTHLCALCNFSNTLFRDISETKARESTKRMSGEKQCFEETKRKEKVMREKELIFCVFALQK